MYRIIGADGKEYGPISADVLRQWIAQGRANAQTKARLEGTTDWKLLTEFPDFAADLAAKSTVTPAATTPLAPRAADMVAADILARDYQFDIGRCISRGWNLVMKHFWLTVGATVLMHLIVAVIGGLPVIGWALKAVFIGGLDWMFLKLVRNEKAELGDSFAGFNMAFLPLSLFGIVSTILVLLGVILCIVPGIYLAVCWLFFTPLIILDKRLEFWDAMELGRKVVSKHWWHLFGFALVCGLVLIAGSLVCVVGVFIALPIVRAAIVYAYEDIFGARPTTAVAAPNPT
jgi:hypothetical protein